MSLYLSENLFKQVYEVETHEAKPYNIERFLQRGWRLFVFERFMCCVHP